MRVLYAEDEKQLSAAVAEVLRMNGYDVDAVYDGEEAWKRLCSQYYDAVILDIMMPKTDGIQVLKQMRARENFAPVMLLTAKAEVEDKIEGLSVGADDYLAKPFSIGELMARLNAMVRRTEQYREKRQSMGNITLDCETNELRSDSGGLRLSSKETRLLSLFLKRVSVSAAHIRERHWADSGDENVVELYVEYLRNKLTQIHSTVNIVETEEGYCLGEVEAYEKT